MKRAITLKFVAIFCMSVDLWIVFRHSYHIRRTWE